MTIEIMYPGFILYGDRGNVEYLGRTFPEAKFVYTQIHDKPYFADHPVDFIYMGPMTEANLAAVTEHLIPHRQRLKELMESGTFFLIINTSN